MPSQSVTGTKIYRVGFTGSRKGMTPKQMEAFQREVFDVQTFALGKDADIVEFHFGDCIGADEQAFQSVQQSFFKTVAHPGDIAELRAYCKAEVIKPPQRPLVRNAAIVAAAHVLFATPEGEEILRSGTWSTIRRARKSGKPICIIYPSGQVVKEKRPKAENN